MKAYKQDNIKRLKTRTVNYTAQNAEMLSLISENQKEYQE